MKTQNKVGPVTITLDTQEEVLLFKQMIGLLTVNNVKDFGVDGLKVLSIYEELSSSLEKLDENALYVDIDKKLSITPSPERLRCAYSVMFSGYTNSY